MRIPGISAHAAIALVAMGEQITEATNREANWRVQCALAQAENESLKSRIATLEAELTERNTSPSNKVDNLKVAA